MPKTDFLVVYDYGMGGLWGIVAARSADEIRSKFPELTVITDRPKWMTDERLSNLHEREWHDIDGAPWGILNSVLEDRRRRGSC